MVQKNQNRDEWKMPLELFFLQFKVRRALRRQLHLSPWTDTETTLQGKSLPGQEGIGSGRGRTGQRRNKVFGFSETKAQKRWPCLCNIHLYL